MTGATINIEESRAKFWTDVGFRHREKVIKPCQANKGVGRQ